MLTPKKCAASAADLSVARSYASFTEMAQREARRKDAIEAVTIVTPNHMHTPVALEFLKRGIHVICDKPLPATLFVAKKLAKATTASGVIFTLTHNYTGYPMIRQAKEIVQAGALGDIRLVQVEYAHDWRANPSENTGQKQTDWRTDPARSGAGGSTGDICTHAFNLANFVSGLIRDTTISDDGGIDTVRTSLSHNLIAPIKKLVLTGTSAIDRTGNGPNNRLIGNTAGNALTALAGNDKLIGNGGTDVLSGGNWADLQKGGGAANTFVFDLLELAINTDQISGFANGTDKFAINATAFGAFAGDILGALDPAAFGLGNRATTNSRHILTNSATDALL